MTDSSRLSIDYRHRNHTQTEPETMPTNKKISEQLIAHEMETTKSRTRKRSGSSTLICCNHRGRHQLINQKMKPPSTVVVVLLAVIMNLLPLSDWFTNLGNSNNVNRHSTLLVGAVSVQKLHVPDLVVIDQLNQAQQQQQHQQQARSSDLHKLLGNGGQPTQQLNSNQPEAASLINTQDQQQQLTFECLISFDKRKDKNLIVKWHHDERNEPIYQWIPELNKRSIAPQYRAFIVPIVPSSATTTATATGQSLSAVGSPTTSAIGGGGGSTNNTNNQIQMLEASFKLVRPSKELGGKYTCSAISSQNDDSKSKKMIVYTPPRSFKFNASRTDIGALLASQRDRLIQLTQPANQQSTSNSKQLPLAYRMRNIENYPQQSFPSSLMTTISPQMYSTIDYVNVNQQRYQQQQQWSPPPPVPIALSNTANMPLQSNNNYQQQLNSGSQTPVSIDSLLRQKSVSQMMMMQPTSGNTAANSFNNRQAAGNSRQQNGVKLICDIDQVFPVPEVSIYRLAKLDGSHPDKLAKLDTKIERDLYTGLYHVQVTSLLDDDELQMKYGLNEPVYFECLIALTNLELSKYADNKRSIIYRPGSMLASSLQGQQSSEEIKFEQYGSGASSSSLLASPVNTTYNVSLICALWFSLAIILLLDRSHVWPVVI